MYMPVIFTVSLSHREREREAVISDYMWWGGGEDGEEQRLWLRVEILKRRQVREGSFGGNHSLNLLRHPPPV